MPPNENNTYIAATSPVSDGDNKLFSRTWFRFFDLVARKIKILDGTESTTATIGTAAALPALPAGYMTIIDSTGVARKVPYYNE